jgi:predicted HicB family RNase H-like nuclease
MGMSKEQKSVVISIDVPEELRDIVKAAAAAEDLSMAVWIRRTLKRSALAKLSKKKEDEE